MRTTITESEIGIPTTVPSVKVPHDAPPDLRMIAFPLGHVRPRGRSRIPRRIGDDARDFVRRHPHEEDHGGQDKLGQRFFDPRGVCPWFLKAGVVRVDRLGRARPHAQLVVMAPVGVHTG